MVDAGAGVRLDAAASIPPLLDFLFAVDGRVRPFNKYLEGEFMRRSPLGGRITLEQLLAILDGDEVEQHAVFCEVERITREHGFGDVVDAWEPDVPWLRGNRAYRAT